MNKIHRRSFIKTRSARRCRRKFFRRSWAQVEGSNSDVRFAVIGFNGRGKDHMSEISKVEGTRLTACAMQMKTVLNKA